MGAQAVASLAFSGEGRLFASGADGDAIFAWNVRQRALESRPLRGHEGGVRSVAFAPGGELLASGSRDGTIVL